MVTPVKILTVGVHPTSYTETCDRMEEWIKSPKSRLVVCANVHMVMTALGEPALGQILQQADRITPDGMPLVWGLRLLGVPRQPRVYGPDLLLAWCDRATKNKSSIFLYGSTPEVLEKLVAALSDRFPGLTIAGTHAPPFGELDPRVDRDKILRSGASVVFVALGCPKQEYWMAAAREQLPLVMVGVGAAFAFHAGTVSQSPRWIMAIGMEWFYRFLQEPRRLWQRYLFYNPLFVILFLSQVIAHWWVKPHQNWTK